MTNTNRGEWAEVAERIRIDHWGFKRTETSDTECHACDDDWPCDYMRAAAIIEKYGEALTRIQQSNGGGTDPSGYMRKVASDALQSPTQAPLQEGATK